MPWEGRATALEPDRPHIVRAHPKINPRYCDFRVSVGIVGLVGLAMVCERELGIVLDKSSQTSNWSRRPLDADQLRYATLDAEVLLALHEHFSDDRAWTGTHQSDSRRGSGA
jgi:hypothetical protein